MSAARIESLPRRKIPVDRPDAGEFELAIHALHGILEAVSWIDDAQIGVSEERQDDARCALIIAGKLITADFRRRF